MEKIKTLRIYFSEGPRNQHRVLRHTMNEPVIIRREYNKFGELSNFYALEKPLVFKSKTYPTSEHLYQSLKYLGPNASPASLEHAEAIRLAPTPSKAKLLSRNPDEGMRARGVVVRADWDLMKVGKMRMVLLMKFQQNEHCRDVLLSTNSRPIVERSERDLFWADGGADGHGKNFLGKLLIEVRTCIQKTLAQRLKRSMVARSAVYWKKKKTAL